VLQIKKKGSTNTYLNVKFTTKSFGMQRFGMTLIVIFSVASHTIQSPVWKGVTWAADATYVALAGGPHNQKFQLLLVMWASPSVLAFKNLV